MQDSQPTGVSRRMSTLPRPSFVSALVLVLVLGVALAPAAGAGTRQDTPSAEDQDRAIGGAAEFGFATFGQQGRPEADYAVLASVEGFADALSGSVLGQRGPILLTRPDGLAGITRSVLGGLLEPGDTVFILGGPAAISTAVEDELVDEGFMPQRLQGASRFETSVAVAAAARELLGDPGEVALARAFGPSDNPTAAWADSVSAGGWAAHTGIPILLSPSDGLHPAVEAHLEEVGPQTVHVLGGTAALDGSFDALPGARRTSGQTRFDTARQVAQQLFGIPEQGPRSYIVFDATDPLGWASGLGAAAFSGMTSSPLIATATDHNPPEALAAVAGCDNQVELVRGGVTDEVLQELDEQDERPC